MTLVVGPLLRESSTARARHCLCVAARRSFEALLGSRPPFGAVGAAAAELVACEEAFEDRGVDLPSGTDVARWP